MSKRQQLYNLIMQAGAGLPDAANIAAHHMNAVSEKNALKHWQIHGAGIQAEFDRRRQQLAMRKAAEVPTQRATPIAPTTKLSAQLKAGKGGARQASMKSSSPMDLVSQRSFYNPVAKTMDSQPYGSTLNLA